MKIKKSKWQPEHISVPAKALTTKQPGGRFAIVPGSPGRAAEMSEQLKDRQSYPSSRGHTVYVGKLSFSEGDIDVLVVATGMGCPSVDIVVNELRQLGIRRFLRIGTAGSLQPKDIKVGDVVIATAAVRDEHTSGAYAPLEVPATASHELVAALRAGALRVGLGRRTHLGLIHTKDSLYAREFGQGPMTPEHDRYMQVLSDVGVLASEMEASHLFILNSTAEKLPRGLEEVPTTLVGCVLTIIGDKNSFSENKNERALGAKNAWQIACEGLRIIYFGSDA